MKVVKKLLVILVLLFICLAILTALDYFFVKNKNYLPRIAIKSENVDKEVIVYNALFYKLYYCTSDDSKIIIDYSDDEPSCPSIYKFANDYYSNSLSLKISKHDIDIMTYNNIYTKEMIDMMSSEEEVENAVFVVNEYIKTMYKEVKEKVSSDKDINYTFIEFPSFEYNKDNNKYELIYNGDKYCFYIDNDTKEKRYSVYYNGKCIDDYIVLKMSDKWCELSKNTTLIYDNDLIKKLCE